MSDNDLSKIIGLIMENPKLIEEIKNLASKDKSEEEAVIITENQASTEDPIQASVEPTFAPSESLNRKKRRELLFALKPYVSEGRSKAIDSMMSIADILDMMREN